MQPVVEGGKCLLFDIEGRNRWVTERLKDGTRQQTPVLPGAHALASMLPLDVAPPLFPPPLTSHSRVAKALLELLSMLL